MKSATSLLNTPKTSAPVIDLGGTACSTRSTTSTPVGSAGACFLCVPCWRVSPSRYVDLINTHIINSADFPMHVSGHISPSPKAPFIRFELSVLQRARDAFKRSRTTPLLASAFARALPVHNMLQKAGVWSNTSYVPDRVLRRLLLGFLHSKLTQMGNFSCLTMVAWPFARALFNSLVMLRMRNTTVVLAFCFRRWHSVHEVVALLSFCVCIVRDE